MLCFLTAYYHINHISAANRRIGRATLRQLTVKLERKTDTFKL